MRIRRIFGDLVPGAESKLEGKPLITLVLFLTERELYPTKYPRSRSHDFVYALAISKDHRHISRICLAGNAPRKGHAYASNFARLYPNKI